MDRGMDFRAAAALNTPSGIPPAPADQPPLLEFNGVSHRYSDEGGEENSSAWVLKNVSFSLPAGSFHFLTGPSGAGKSTLLKLMYLGMRPTQGDVQMFSKDVLNLPRQQLPRLRRRIGVVFQDFRLLPHLSIVENVALPLRLAGASPAQIKAHVPELLRWVGLGDHLYMKPLALSGGQQQRVAIARAVINRPALLLADEPTGNVDDEIAIRLMHLFIELNKLGTTVVIASHNKMLMDKFRKPTLALKDGQMQVLR
jgi:cell division transport system ATP-binding protein